MPLIKGKSDKSFSKNVATEMHAGKPQDQSLAIAYSVKRKAKKKMAEGGDVEDRPKFDVNSQQMLDAEKYNKASDERRKQQSNQKMSLPEVYFPGDKAGERYAKGGEIQNHMLHPGTGNAPKTESVADESLSRHAEEHEEIAQPEEPMEHVYPGLENIPDHMLSDGGMVHKIMAARRMAQGGQIDPKLEDTLKLNRSYPDPNLQEWSSMDPHQKEMEGDDGLEEQDGFFPYDQADPESPQKVGSDARDQSDNAGSRVQRVMRQRLADGGKVDEYPSSPSLEAEVRRGTDRFTHKLPEPSPSPENHIDADEAEKFRHGFGNAFADGGEVDKKKKRMSALFGK